MTYVTENTQWLSKDITPEAKTVVARFYELADSRQSDAGHLMASEVFTQDAVLVSPNGTFQGFNGMSIKLLMAPGQSGLIIIVASRNFQE